MDQYNRRIDYARISLTSACNLACVYCRKNKEVKEEAFADLKQLLFLGGCLAKCDISKIKLTGGEPSLYPHLEALIEGLFDMEGIEHISLTTNGIGLKNRLAALKSAGLEAITFSLDTLDSKLYETITRQDGLEEVLEAIKEAAALGFNVKVNCVPFSLNEKSYLDVALLAKNYPVQVRFIEMMPVGLGRYFKRIDGQQIYQALSQKFGRLQPTEKQFGHGPASYFQIEGWKGHIGLILPISHEFCARCNRIRITSSLHLQACLNSKQTTDLKPYLKPEREEECLKLLQSLIYHKPARHGFEKEGQNKKMSQIGG